MKTTVSALLMTALLALVGCNTVQGLGQDIQKGGQVLEDAAKKR
jgi:predicted small secreted protein